MKPLLIIGAISFLFIQVSAQGRSVFPRYNADSIRQKVNFIQGEYYYPKLLLRFAEGDSTMGPLHYYLIYFGLPFQPHYSPYAKANDELRKKFLERSYLDALNEGQKIIAENPANVTATYYTFMACKKSGYEAEAALFKSRYFIFMEAILSSGDGKSRETAFVLNSVDDEYQVLAYLDLRFKRNQLKMQEGGKFFDRFQVKPGKLYREKEVYFDITHAFNRLGKQLENEE